MLESGNILVDPNNPINVEDRANLTHHKKWCTKVPNMYGHFIHITITKVELKLPWRMDPWRAIELLKKWTFLIQRLRES